MPHSSRIIVQNSPQRCYQSMVDRGLKSSHHEDSPLNDRYLCYISLKNFATREEKYRNLLIKFSFSGFLRKIWYQLRLPAYHTLRMLGIDFPTSDSGQVILAVPIKTNSNHHHFNRCLHGKAYKISARTPQDFFGEGVDVRRAYRRVGGRGGAEPPHAGGLEKTFKANG